MAIDMNLDGVEAWSGDAILSPGIHPVKVVEVEETVKNGAPQFVLSMKAIGGAEAGGTIRDWITVTPDSLGRVAMIMQAFGMTIPEGQFVLDPTRFKGQVANVVVRQSTWEGKTRNKVQGYQPAKPGDIPTAGQPQTAAAAVGAPASQQQDDDIPF